MKKLINTSFFYFIFAMISGVFFREFTKFNDFTGQTMLSGLHTHLFSLGAMFFLIILALVMNKKDLLGEKVFVRFYWTYNISLVSMAILMYVRGIIEVLGIDLSKMADASISGIAGLTHIGMTVGLVFFYKWIKNIVRESND